MLLICADSQTSRCAYLFVSVVAFAPAFWRQAYFVECLCASFCRTIRGLSTTSSNKTWNTTKQGELIWWTRPGKEKFQKMGQFTIKRFNIEMSVSWKTHRVISLSPVYCFSSMLTFRLSLTGFNFLALVASRAAQPPRLSFRSSRAKWQVLACVVASGCCGRHF